MAKGQLKQDNRGFTLIEVLIAMVILAIIVVPLLHTFVSSSRTNRIARQRLRQTTTAQDIMEGLKACTIEELAYQFNYPDASHATNPLIEVKNEFHVLNRSLVHGDIKEIRLSGGSYADAVRGEEAATRADVTASMYSVNNGVDYEFQPSIDGHYYFKLCDVAIQADPNVRYDALIHLDAAKYRAGGTASNLVNAEEVVNIREMNNLYDAFYTSTENEIYDVLFYINTMCSPTVYVLKEHLNRTITIDVEEHLVAGETVTTANIYTKYIAVGVGPGGTNIEYEPLGATGAQIFNNMDTEMELRNVYLFYFPLYGSTAKDEIIFNNTDKIPLTFHITKQEPSTVTTALMSAERNYKCDVKLYDGASSQKVITLRTNLGRNLYDAHTPGVVNARPLYISYFLNGVSKTETDLGVTNLSGEEVNDRLFDVTIDLYEGGAAAAGFPADQLVTTLTGSKVN